MQLVEGANHCKITVSEFSEEKIEMYNMLPHVSIDNTKCDHLQTVQGHKIVYV